MKTLTIFTLFSSFAVIALSGCGSGPEAGGSQTGSSEGPVVGSDDHGHGHSHEDGHDHSASLPFELEIVNASRTIPARQAVDVRFVVRNLENGQVQTRFDTVHEEKLHLIVVDEGLTFFQHLHPVMDEDGFWTERLTFPYGGRFLVFADGSVGGSHFNAGTGLSVDGSPAPEPLFELSARSRAEGVSAEIVEGTRLPLSDHSHVTVKLSEASGWELYLGEPGHLIVISQDGKEFVHAHPKGAMENGAVTFDAHFQAPGVYRAWAQFQRGGKVLTFPFTFEVGDAQ